MTIVPSGREVASYQIGFFYVLYNNLGVFDTGFQKSPVRTTAPC